MCMCLATQLDRQFFSSVVAKKCSERPRRKCADDRINFHTRRILCQLPLRLSPMFDAEMFSWLNSNLDARANQEAERLQHMEASCLFIMQMTLEVS